MSAWPLISRLRQPPNLPANSHCLPMRVMDVSALQGEWGFGSYGACGSYDAFGSYDASQ